MGELESATGKLLAEVEADLAQSEELLRASEQEGERKEKQLEVDFDRHA